MKPYHVDLRMLIEMPMEIKKIMEAKIFCRKFRMNAKGLLNEANF